MNTSNNIDEKSVAIIFKYEGKTYARAYNFEEDLKNGNWEKIDKTIMDFLPRTGLLKLKELTGRLAEETDFIENMPERYETEKDKFKNIAP